MEMDMSESESENENEIIEENKCASDLVTEFGDGMFLSFDKTLKKCDENGAKLTTQLREIVVLRHENSLCSVYFCIFVHCNV